MKPSERIEEIRKNLAIEMGLTELPNAMWIQAIVNYLDEEHSKGGSHRCQCHKCPNEV